MRASKEEAAEEGEMEMELFAAPEEPMDSAAAFLLPESPRVLPPPACREKAEISRRTVHSPESRLQATVMPPLPSLFPIFPALAARPRSMNWILRFCRTEIFGVRWMVATK